MQITLNNQPMVLATSLSLHGLLKKINRLEPDFALAVNRQIISRSHWPAYYLNEGDSVTLIEATAGG